MIYTFQVTKFLTRKKSGKAIFAELLLCIREVTTPGKKLFKAKCIEIIIATLFKTPNSEIKYFF